MQAYYANEASCIILCIPLGLVSKNRIGCSQDSSKHSVVENTRGIYAQEVQKNSSYEIEDNQSYCSGGINSHPLVCREITGRAGREV